jgi:hypothetical protein
MFVVPYLCFILIFNFCGNARAHTSQNLAIQATRAIRENQSSNILTPNRRQPPICADDGVP